MTKTFRTFFLLSFVVTILSSCTSGWTEENKADITRSCISGAKMSYSEEEAQSICNCYIENIVKKYPAMDYTSEQNTAELDACSADARKKLLEEKARLFEDPSMLNSSEADSLLKDSLNLTPAP